MRWSRTPILLLLSRCLTIRRAPQKEWLLYPAYPRHFFSLRGLVHIYIPQTGTPCGRVMGQRSYSLSWAPVLSVALPSPFVPLLYHNLGGLSRGNFRGCPAFCYSPANSLGRASSAFPLAWLRFPLPLPLTPLVYHRPHTKSTGNVAQIREK